MKSSKSICNVATLIEHYFTERLMRQRNVSANTIASYRDTFRLLFSFAQARLRKPPSASSFGDLDAPFIGAFLTDLETRRGAAIRTRNLRLTAIRSFFRFVSFEEPAHSAMIQRVLAIPRRRRPRAMCRQKAEGTMHTIDHARSTRPPVMAKGPGIVPQRARWPAQRR
jgi:integrase/recombinase XerD